MLPQPDAHVLAANPQFAALHTNLCLRKLNKNGTSKITDAKQIKERLHFQEVSGCLTLIEN